MDDVGYGALAVALMLAGGFYTWSSYTRHGLAAGMRGASFTLLVLAAYLTKTLQMFGRVADAVVDWATSLVFSPVVWLGIVVGGIAVVLFGASRVLERRTPRATEPARSKQLPAVSSKPSSRAAAPIDDEMADIEALLRNRGIT